MRLYEMYTPFTELTQEKQEAFVASYREARNIEIVTSHTGSKSRKRKPALSLSPAEALILKKLGISKRALSSLK